MTRNSGGGTVYRIAIHSMSASFTNEEAFVHFDVPDEVGSLHKYSSFMRNLGCSQYQFFASNSPAARKTFLKLFTIGIEN